MPSLAHARLTRLLEARTELGGATPPVQLPPWGPLLARSFGAEDRYCHETDLQRCPLNGC